MEKDQLEARVAELEKQIEELSALARETADVREIQEVQYRYLDALMAMEWDKCAECFAEDALVDVYLHEPVRGAGGSKMSSHKRTRATRATSASTPSSRSTATRPRATSFST